MLAAYSQGDGGQMAPGKDRLDKPVAAMAEEWQPGAEDGEAPERRDRWARRMVGVVAFVAILALVSPSLYWRGTEVALGGTAVEAVVAPFALEVVNRTATNELRYQAALAAPAVYAYDASVADNAAEGLDGLLAAAREVAAMDVGSTTPAGAQRLRVEELGRRATALGLPGFLPATLETLLARSNRDEFHLAALDLIGAVYERGAVRGPVVDPKSLVVLGPKKDAPPALVAEELLEIGGNLPGFVRLRASRAFSREAPGGDAARQALAEVALALTQQPNVLYQKGESERRRREERDRVKPVVERFERGAVLVAQGARIGQRELDIVRELNRRQFRHFLLQQAGNALLILLMMWFSSFYVLKFLPELPLDATNLWLMALPGLTGLALGKLALVLLPEYGAVGPYLFPAGLVGMLGVLLLGARVAMMMVVSASLLFGLAADMRFEYALVGIFGGMAGLVSLHALRERRQLIFAGCVVAATNMACIATLTFLKNAGATGGADDYSSVLAGLANGVGCMALVWILPPIFERVFGVVTDFRLLEITARHPLLGRLEREAPGTYQHSLNVAKLAEAAADAIGASFLLVRAGAYFHDIGKIVKREYYTENQVTPEERAIHGKLTPNMSTLLIRNHVKEGIELGRKYGLPPRVIDAIPQHHGTSLITYFYNLALKQFEESESRDPVVEEDFRYPGPKPQTPETAILMMADSVEATAHSMLTGGRVTTDDIRRLVLDTVRARFNDGQFDECHLTLRDLHLISLSFIQSLRARYHERVDYRKALA